MAGFVAVTSTAPLTAKAWLPAAAPFASVNTALARVLRVEAVELSAARVKAEGDERVPPVEEKRSILSVPI